MNRFLFLALVGLLALALVGLAGCGGKKEVAEEITPETTQVVPPDTEPEPPPPPPPPPPKLEESQFQTAHFDFDKFNLSSDAKASLDHNYNLLNEFPDAIIKIEGHCDERGTVEYNLSLGEKRAKAAQEYLVGLGIAPNRISIISWGKERPADSGHSEDAWQKNRRSEFRVISQ